MSPAERIIWSDGDGASVVQLVGEFDLADVDEIRGACAVATDGSSAPPQLVIDLSQTTFLDSSALGALVGVAQEARERNGWLRFAAARHAVVRRVLEITEVDDALGLYETVQEAAQPDD